jgi:hypothetical protein
MGQKVFIGKNYGRYSWINEWSYRGKRGIEQRNKWGNGKFYNF